MAINSLQIEFSMYMNIPYCKGALLDNVNVATLVVYATIEKTTQSAKHGAKNPVGPKICLGIGTQKPAKNLAPTKIFYRQKLFIL